MDHISQQFDADLGAIKGHVLGMGGLVERQIGDALHAIIEADSQRAEVILAREREVNRMELSVDDEVVLNSGVIGFVTALEEMDGSQIAWIDIAQVGDKPVEVRVLRSSIARRIVPEQGASDGAKSKK